MTEVIKNAAGQEPAWSDGHYFAPHQGEWFQMGWGADCSSDERRYAGIDWQIGLVELDTGEWLAHPPGLATYNERFPNRTAALRHAVAAVIRSARWRARQKDPMYLSFRIYPNAADTVIAWALALLDRKPRALFMAPPPPAPLPLGQLEMF